jgi:hypothetical protein
MSYNICGSSCCEEDALKSHQDKAFFSDHFGYEMKKKNICLIRLRSTSGTKIARQSTLLEVKNES